MNLGAKMAKNKRSPQEVRASLIQRFRSDGRVSTKEATAKADRALQKNEAMRREGKIK
jgi:hypothetical protein